MVLCQSFSSRQVSVRLLLRMLDDSDAHAGEGPEAMEGKSILQLEGMTIPRGLIQIMGNEPGGHERPRPTMGPEVFFGVTRGLKWSF